MEQSAHHWQWKVLSHNCIAVGIAGDVSAVN